MNNISIYQYLDVREWILAIYEFRNAAGKYSYAQLSEDLGLGDRSYVQHVLAGRKKFSLENLGVIATAMNLTQAESDYLQLLDQYEHAADFSQKQDLWTKLKTQFQADSVWGKLSPKQLDILEDWYIIPTLELLTTFSLSDPQVIAKTLKPKVPVAKVRECIQLLQDLALIEKGLDGGWVATQKIFYDIPTGTYQKTLIRHFQLQMLSLASNALISEEVAERHIRTLTLTMSAEVKAQAANILDQAIKDIAALVQLDSNPTSVVEINLALFPLTKELS